MGGVGGLDRGIPIPLQGTRGSPGARVGIPLGEALAFLAGQTIEW